MAEKFKPTKEQLEHYEKTGSLIFSPAEAGSGELERLKSFFEPTPIIIKPDAIRTLVIDKAELEKFMPGVLPGIIDPGAHKRFTDPHIEHIMPIEPLSFEVREDSVITRSRIKTAEAFKWHAPSTVVRSRMISDVDEEWEFDLASGKVQVGDIIHTGKGELCQVTPGGLIHIADASHAEDERVFERMKSAPPGRGLLEQIREIETPDWSEKLKKAHKNFTADKLMEAIGKAFEHEPGPKDLMIHTGAEGMKEFGKAMRAAVGIDDFTLDDLIHQPTGKLKELLRDLLDEELTYDMDPDDVRDRRLRVSEEIEKRLKEEQDNTKKLFHTMRIKDGTTIHTKRSPVFDNPYKGGVDPYRPLESHKSLFLDYSDSVDSVKPEMLKTMGIMLRHSTPVSPIFGDGPAGKSLTSGSSWLSEVLNAGTKWLSDVTGLDKREREK